MNPNSSTRSNDLAKLQRALATQSLSHLMDHRRQEGTLSQSGFGYPPPRSTSSLRSAAAARTPSVNPLYDMLVLEHYETKNALRIKAAAAQTAIFRRASLLLTRDLYHRQQQASSLANSFLDERGTSLLHQGIPPSSLEGRTMNKTSAARTSITPTNRLLVAPTTLTRTITKQNLCPYSRHHHRNHSVLYPAHPLATTAPTITINVTKSNNSSRTTSAVEGEGTTVHGSSAKKLSSPQFCQSSSPIISSEAHSTTMEEEEVEASRTSNEDKSSTLPRAASSSRKKKFPRQDKWFNFYNQLKAYKKRHGDCHVPRGYFLNPQLGRWVARQRQQYKGTRPTIAAAASGVVHDQQPNQESSSSSNSIVSMLEERYILLEELGFSWNAKVSAWEVRLEQLKAFKQEFGHCIVPIKDAKQEKLARWIREQRRFYKCMQRGEPASGMTPYRAQLLEKAGICWYPKEEVWNGYYRELCEFKTLHGHTNVPTLYKGNRGLRLWRDSQRRQYNSIMRNEQKTHLTPSQKKALEDIGISGLLKKPPVATNISSQELQPTQHCIRRK